MTSTIRSSAWFLIGLAVGFFILSVFGSEMVHASVLPEGTDADDIICETFEDINGTLAVPPGFHLDHGNCEADEEGGGTGTTTPPGDTGGDNGTSTPPTGDNGDDNGTTTPSVPIDTGTTDSTPVSDPAPSTGSGAPGGGGNGPVSGPLAVGAGGGVVAGTSTESLPSTCSAFLTGYMKMGKSNNPEQVTKLQNFLNEFMHANLPVSGFFGPATFKAVSDFQTQEFEHVLTPWVAYGLPSDHTSTGYVYKTTLRWINLIKCKELNTPLPQLP